MPTLLPVVATLTRRDGRGYEGFEGDTIASALYAAGVSSSIATVAIPFRT